MCRADPERGRWRGSGADPERGSGHHAQEKKASLSGFCSWLCVLHQPQLLCPQMAKDKPTNHTSSPVPHLDLQAALCASEMLIPEAEIQAAFPSELLGPAVMVSNQAPHFF